MFTRDEFLTLALKVAKDYGLSNLDGFKKSLDDAIPENLCIGKFYTEEFFWAYRAKFDLGFEGAASKNAAKNVTTGNSKLNNSREIIRSSSPAKIERSAISFIPSFEKKEVDEKIMWMKNVTTGNSKLNNSREIIRSSSPAKIERSATSFIPSFEKKEVDEKIMWMKKIRTELNKLALENYDVIAPKVLSIVKEDHQNALPSFIELMFGKVQVDEKYLPLYSKMCVEFNDQFSSSFKNQLLVQCQIEVNKPKPPIPDCGLEPKTDEDKEEIADYEDAITKWKCKRMVTLKFVVELKKSAIVDDVVIETILKELLSHNVQNPNSDDLSHACELLALSLSIIDQKISRRYFARLDEFKNAGKLAAIDCVKIQNAIEENDKFLNEQSKPAVYKPKKVINKQTSLPAPKRQANLPERQVNYRSGGNKTRKY